MLKPVEINEFCNLKFLSNPTFSPDGSRAAFTVTSADEKKNRYNSNIYTFTDGKPRRLTNGNGEGRFIFLDNDTILFPANREEKSDEPSLVSRYYKISLSGGEAELAFEFPVPVGSVLPVSESDFIVTATVFPGYEELYKGDEKLAAKYLAESKKNADYEEITQMPWWWNGGSFTKASYDSLYRYSAKTKKLTRISDVGYAVSDVSLSPDKKYVYYSVMNADTPKPDYFGEAAVKRTELSSGITELLAESRKGFRIGACIPCESFDIILASDEKFGMNTDPDFYKLDPKTKEITLYCKYGLGFHSSVGSDIRYGGGRGMKVVEDTLYFISTVFDSANIYKLEDGSITPVTDNDGSVDSFDICGGKLLVNALWGMKAQELYDEKGRRLTSFNKKTLADKYTAVPEKLNFTRNGTELHGFVLKPYGFEKGKKFPVILDIHGGPKTVYGEAYYHEMQYWAGKGYFVIYCNPTGSDGRGGFMDITGKYGTVDYEDIMSFCDEFLAAYPEADADNMFETGGSYGGFMTNWIIGHTDRFRACASQRSISNWFSFCGVSDIGYPFAVDQNRADPWDDTEKMWFHSPLKYARNVKTPTLFIHSFEDYRCPIDQGYQMFSALVFNGVEAKMVCFRGENHELSRSGKPQHRIKRLKEITEWFENHRKK